MKKTLIVSLLVCTVFVAGCGNKANAKEEAMKEYAIKFYESHQKGDNGLTTPTVSIEQLKTAIEVVGDQYDMTKLDGCADTSYVELKIDESKNVTDVVYHMECK